MSQKQAASKLQAAIKAGEARDYPKAVQLLLDLLTTEDGPLEARLYLARAYHAMGEWGPAISNALEYLELGGEAGPGWFFLGRAYLSAGLARQAAVSFQKSLEAAPGQAWCLGLYAYASLKLNRPQRALQLFEQAIALAPGDGRIYRGYLNALQVCGIRKYQAGDHDMAAQMLSFALDNGLDALHIRLYLASSLSALGRWEEAISQYDAAIEAGADEPAILIGRARALAGSGRAAEAGREWQRLRAKEPYLPDFTEDQSTLLAGSALAELQAGAYRRCADAAVAGLRISPKSAILHSLAAEAYRNLGAHEKAENHYRRALESERQDAGARLGLSMALWSQGRWAEAQKEIRAWGAAGGEKAIVDYYSLLAQARLEEPNAKLLKKLLSAIEERGGETELMKAAAAVAFGLGQPSLALPWYRELSEMGEASDAEALSYIACLEAVGPAEELEGAYQRYLETWPDNVAIRREYADKLRSVLRWEDAAAQYGQLIPYEGESLSLKRVLALCLRMSGHYREAALHYRDLALRDESHSEWAKALCFCLYRMGRRAEALKLAAGAKKRYPGDAGVLLIEGWLQARAGKREEAMDAFRAAAEADPDSTHPWDRMAELYRDMGMDESAARCEQQSDSIHRRVEAALSARKAKAGSRASAPGPVKSRVKAAAPSARKGRP